MSEHAIPLDEFDYEMDATRRLLERVPTEKGEWKPHEKSFPLGHLAQLVSWIPGWIASALVDDAYDSEERADAYSFEPTEALLEKLDRRAGAARDGLESVTGAALEEEWSLKSGDFVMYTAKRGVAARNHLNHLIHHRGQLTVYLRLLDVLLPSIYGPTADEPAPKHAG